MAIIGKIRENSILLMIVIGGALLLFVLSEAFSSNMFGSGVKETYIAEYNGKGVTQLDYDRVYNYEYDKAKQEFFAQYGQPQNQEQAQFINNLWLEREAKFSSDLKQKVIYDLTVGKLLEERYKELGIHVGSDELNEMVQGMYVDPQFYEQNGLFVDRATRKFSRDSLIKHLPNILNNPNPGTEAYWVQNIEVPLKNRRKQTLYTNMISDGIYTNHLEAKQSLMNDKSNATVNYVFKPYSSISNEEVSISDEDIEKYYNKHKNEKRFDNESSIRSIEYVKFMVEPSEKDKIDAKNRILDMKKQFEESKNDSSFVLRKSDNPSYDGTYLASSEFPAELDSVIQDADSSSIIGPYLSENGDFYNLSKVTGVKNVQEARVKHILLGAKYGSDSTSLQKLADSLMRVIRTRNNFDTIVKDYSTDYATIPNNGIIEWFSEDDANVQTEQFREKSINNGVGSMFTIKTPQGMSIVKVLEKRNAKRFRVATLKEKVYASKNTREELERAAKALTEQFLSMQVSQDEFQKKSIDLGLKVETSGDIYPQSPNLVGVERPLSLMKWMFQGKVGEISPVLSIDQNTYVVAHITKAINEGIASLDDAKDIIKDDLLNDKKYELYSSKTASSLSDIATAWGTQANNNTTISLSTSSFNNSTEPNVIGEIFRLNKGDISAPIKGKNGIYVVEVVNINKAGEISNEEIIAKQEQIKNQNKSRISYQVFGDVLKFYDVKDNRQKNEVIDPNK